MTDTSKPELMSRAWPLGAYAPGGYMCKCAYCGGQFEGDKRAISCIECAARKMNASLSSAKAEIERLNGLVERLRQEARFHSSEARAANTTVYESLQAASGATGEKGNWHGAEPIKEALAAKDAVIAELVSAIAKDRADWLVDAVATITQNRAFLRGDPECDEVACEAIQINGDKAIRVAIERALANQHKGGK